MAGGANPHNPGKCTRCDRYALRTSYVEVTNRDTPEMRATVHHLCANCYYIKTFDPMRDAGRERLIQIEDE